MYSALAAQPTDHVIVSTQITWIATGILSDPQKKHKYDQGGFDNLNPSDMQVEVDLTSLGFVNTAMAAFFSKLGKHWSAACAVPSALFSRH